MRGVCLHCGDPLGPRYRALDFRRALRHGKVWTVLASDVYPRCCSKACWEAYWPRWAGQLGLTCVFPDTAADSAPCGFCGAAVLLSAAHLSVCAVELEELPRFDEGAARVHSDRTLAVICSACDDSQETAAVRARRMAWA